MTDAASNEADLAQGAVKDSELGSVTRSVARRLRDVGGIGADPGGGWSRIGITNTERDAHRLFAQWGAEIGLSLREDAIGNSYACRSGESPSIMMGSHLDSVPHGGNFDGAAGVIAAIEAASLLQTSELQHGLTAVCFSCEEGARFTTPCIGSRVATGSLEPQRLRQLIDAKGVSAYQAALALGFDPDQIEIWPPGTVGCYLELHIEQGRILWGSDRRIGIVDTIAGSTRMEMSVTGRSDHSGTTPMAIRHDALVGAAEVVLAAEQAAKRGRTSVATVGRFAVQPGVITTIPGEARFSVDVRDIDPVRQREVAEVILHQLSQVATARGLSVAATLMHDQSPFVLPFWVREQLAQVAADAGVPFRVMPSGAGHDAGYVGMVAPAGMIFVPSRDGLSHAPDEWSEAEDIAIGAILLARAIQRIDRGAMMNV